MIRAFRIILCAYEPLSLPELAEAVSICFDGTLDVDIVDDNEFQNLKSLCYNFLRFPTPLIVGKALLNLSTIPPDCSS